MERTTKLFLEALAETKLGKLEIQLQDEYGTNKILLFHPTNKDDLYALAAACMDRADALEDKRPLKEKFE